MKQYSCLFATNFHSICHTNAQHMLYWLLIWDSQDDLQTFALHLPIRETLWFQRLSKRARRFTPPPRHAAVTTKLKYVCLKTQRRPDPLSPESREERDNFLIQILL